jgi:hypothetical protein
MNDIEINSIARGTFMYLVDQCKDPLDALSVILCLVLLFYERAKVPDADFTIEEFAGRFHNDMVVHWKARTPTSEGTGTIQ